MLGTQEDWLIPSQVYINPKQQSGKVEVKFIFISTHYYGDKYILRKKLMKYSILKSMSSST